jgi:hypothetical protein
MLAVPVWLQNAVVLLLLVVASVSQLCTAELELHLLHLLLLALQR